MILADVEVVAVERVSPTFVRVELGGAALADFGVDGPLYDQRIKLIFPTVGGALPSLSTGPSWYADRLALPAHERGHMRTYTIREVRGSGPDTRLVVDLVLHLAPGRTGPGSAWAARARRGDRVVVVAPHRDTAYGGIEFAPGDAPELLLVADETAVPALCGILRDLAPDARGTAFAEVPGPGDVLPVSRPAGVRLVWLARESAQRGLRQVDAVRRHLGLPPAPGLVEDRLVGPDVWETPTHSAGGEAPADACADTADPRGRAGLYAWIAGESRVVTTLRRALVGEAGLARSQVAFMGYWRDGIAMRS